MSIVEVICAFEKKKIHHYFPSHTIQNLTPPYPQQSINIPQLDNH